MIRFLHLMGAALALAFAGAASAQSTGAEQWHFQLEPSFFASPAAEIEARAEVRDLAAQLTGLSANLDTPAELLTALETEDRMQRSFRRHDLYLFLRFAVDTAQTEGLDAADELRRLRGAASDTLRAAIAAKPDAWIAAAITADPAVARYSHYLATVRADAARRPSPDTDAAIAAFAPLHSGRDYSRTVQQLTYPPVMVRGEALDYQAERSRIETDGDADVRAAGERAFFAGYAGRRDLFAHLLSDSIAGANAVARLHGYADAIGEAIGEATGDAHVSRDHYRGLLDAVAAHAQVFRAWDARTRDPFAGDRRWTAAEAVAAITASAASLGEPYCDAFAALLDPANGRADLAGTGDRLPLRGTASVYPIGTSAIYMQQFDGTLLDLIVAAHEGGHAVQADLMFANQVPMVEAAGPGYFTESFGRFQELLLLDHLYRSAADGADRALFRDALAARLLSVFNSAEEAAIELAIHEADGAPLTADRLDALTAEAGGRYSNDFAELPERRGVWMVSEGYFMAPMQELNDAYASLLAVRYYQAFRADPQAFAAAYRSLLSRGYDAPPGEMLSGGLGIDLLAGDFAETTLAALDAEIAELYR